MRIGETALSRDGWTTAEQRDISEVRWWTAAEIAASDEWFAPRHLSALLPPVLAGEYPRTPVDAGV